VFPELRSNFENTFAPVNSTIISSIVGVICLSLLTALIGKRMSTQIQGSYGSLLSYATAVDLNIIPTIRVVHSSVTDDIINNFADRFEGIFF
jgi:hypothetical protein